MLIPDLLARNERMASMLLGVALATALFCGGLQETRAQSGEPTTTNSQHLDILLTPYLWTPWASVDVSPFDTRIPGASGTIGAGKLISHLTWVPFMGAAELRYGQYGLLADYIHTPFKAGISTRGILFGSATAGSTANIGTAMGLYRPISRPDQYLDLGLGVRTWGLDGDISLARRFLPPVSVFRGTAWADPLISARYHHELGNGFGATAYGDVGGFGISAHVDWQFVGTIDYTARSGIDLHAGFRGMGFDKDTRASELDVKMYGPFIALTFHL